MSDSLRPHRWQPTRLPRPWDSPGKNTGVGCHFLLQCMKVKSESEVTESCPTLSDPMDCSLPSSSVHGIFQARVLEWGATAFSNKDKSQKHCTNWEKPDAKKQTNKQKQQKKTIYCMTPFIWNFYLRQTYRDRMQNGVKKNWTRLNTHVPTQRCRGWWGLTTD